MKTSSLMLVLLALSLSACGESEAEKQDKVEAAMFKKVMGGACTRMITPDEARRGVSCKEDKK